ncbi:hypothetical protein [Sorangium cellulosum]|uniref:hypothetical protein n=1 Tax=Sorangium cellulosum TaxID=56 RepID=UPI001F1BE534|nr:hypothetical protein [Sorangium cellulosum]
MCFRSGPGSAAAWRRARQAALFAFAALPVACSDLGPGDGELAEIEGGEAVELADGEVASAAQALALPFPIDPRKSLLVTDVDIVSEFKLEEVLQQLIDQSGVTGLTPTTLFHQLLDTHRTDASGLFPDVEHCDEVPGSRNDIHPPFNPNEISLVVPFEQQVPTGSRNGWPMFCPRDIGNDATRDPFSDPSASHAFMATTLANRFDLASPQGADCGEYRLVFARRSGASSALVRSFIIFEARLPNPNPSLGRQACRPVVEFWQNLSDPAKSPATRASELKAFYFNGLPDFEPVIHIDHYGSVEGPERGQIRTNDFTFNTVGLSALNTTWTLRELKLRHGTSSDPSLSIVPSFVNDNPAAKLFAPITSTDPRIVAFQGSVFPGAVDRLAATDDINRFAYRAPLPVEINAGESVASPLHNNYLNAFGDGGTLKAAITSKLSAAGSGLTAEQIVARAQTLSCAGCHQPMRRDGNSTSTLDVGVPGAFFPRSLSFTHTSEKTEPIDGTSRRRFLISDALIDVFLPYRKQVMEEFLLNNPVLGFETLSAWTPTSALLFHHTGRVKEGIASLEVRPLARTSTVTSASFSTADLTPVGNKVKLEIFVPKVPAGQILAGSVEARLSIPSAGINTLSVGSVSLSGATQGAFNTVVFPDLPASAVTALNAAPSDVQLQFLVTLPISSRPYYLDKVRFEN